MRINEPIIETALKNNTIKKLMDSLCVYDKYTYNHSLFVAELSVALGKQLNLNTYDLKELSYTALLHDIGKISIENKLIEKTSALTDEEFRIVRLHPLYGANILNTYSIFSVNVKSGVLMHHENYDGTGYLTKTYGCSIPIFARILRITDSYAAMKSGRPYQKPKKESEIKTELLKGSKKSYDPDILKTFLER